MKILMLTPYLPYPLLSGGQIRTYNLLKKLAHKHEITLFALIKDQSEKKYIPEIEKFCKKVRVFKRSKNPFTPRNIFRTCFSSYPFLVMRNHVPETIKAVEKELTSQKYDLIHAETFYMVPHIPQTTVPTILVEQTIEYLGYESYAKKISWPIRVFLNFDIKKIKHWEKHYWQQADKLIVMSKDDQKYIQQHVKNPAKVEVVSNGVDSDWFDQTPRQLPKQPTILSVGTFKWLPNIEAVKFLYKKVWPLIKQKLPAARLWIVGNAPTTEILAYQTEDSTVKVTGQIKDIRDAFKQAHILLAPVFSGKGTRYKILEAMASGTPIVATSTAVEGLNVADGQQVMIADDADKMAELALRLIADKQLWQHLSETGRKFVRANYDWELISQKLDKIYQSIS